MARRDYESVIFQTGWNMWNDWHVKEEVTRSETTGAG